MRKPFSAQPFARVFNNAASGTAEADELVWRAIRALAGFQGRTVNGFGIYGDPSQRRRDLAEARDSINDALKVMADTPWPTSADYDAADAAGY